MLAIACSHPHACNLTVWTIRYSLAMHGSYDYMQICSFICKWRWLSVGVYMFITKLYIMANQSFKGWQGLMMEGFKTWWYLQKEMSIKIHISWYIAS